ncbi:4-hydroxybenzoate polyprenyltransferase [Legionella norrlandica]|uniref:4-hydroxybenzoate octaprenyltransferase n=1 Tax=Legionella norrlandica TaxID=1498499 RepID=A0A0A2TAL9_9GAMM|nr:4-hydroxybenzoate octaprenyltransferase [Legionella norrlandica]KGP64443.1 4-hydroxybenzoate polyprenyltransferase [Legionella norrlandica]
MIPWGSYVRLLRLDKPIGILLLWYPTAWGLWIANQGVPPFNLLVLFLLGTIFMRSAGCIVNDIADRNLDRYVARTKLRPLTSGEVSLHEAFGLLFVLLFASLLLLLELPIYCFYLALIAVAIIFLYPFCKRFLNMPQMVLGVAFSLGIPMAFIASEQILSSNFILLFLINFAWIMAYDTMYAMTDKADDLKIGIKSTAIYFANYDRLIIALLQCFFHFLWLVWGIKNNVEWFFYCFWLAATPILIYQQKLIYARVPENCFKAFLISSYYGLVMWFAVGVGFL